MRTPQSQIIEMAVRRNSTLRVVEIRYFVNHGAGEEIVEIDVEAKDPSMVSEGRAQQFMDNIVSSIKPAYQQIGTVNGIYYSTKSYEEVVGVAVSDRHVSIDLNVDPLPVRTYAPDQYELLEVQQIIRTTRVMFRIPS